MAVSNPEVRELIAGWLKYQKDKNISEPQDVDVKNYLVSKGFDSTVIDNSIKSLPDKKTSNKAKKTNTSNIDKSKRQNIKVKNTAPEKDTSKYKQFRNEIRNLDSHGLYVLKKELKGG